MPDDTQSSPDFDLFFKAVIRGDFEDVKRRYEDKYLTMTNGSGWTPLHRACYQGSREVVSYLLDKGADIEAQTYLYLWRPLHCAAYYGQPAAVITLIEMGCSLEGITERKETAYDMAKRENKEDCTVILKEAMKIPVLLKDYKSSIEDTDLLSVLTEAIDGHYSDIRKEKLPPVMYKIVEAFGEVYKEGIFDKVLRGKMISSILKSKMDCLKASVNLLSQSHEDPRSEYLYDTLRAYLKDLRDVRNTNHEVTCLTETFLTALHDLHRGSLRNFDGDTIETLWRCFRKYTANEYIRTLAGFMIVAAINVGTAGSTTEGHLTKEDINEIVCYLKVVYEKGDVSVTTTTRSFTAGSEEQVGLQRSFIERWIPSMTDYRKVAQLDNGSYGDINLCEDARTKVKFVIKKIEINPKWMKNTNSLEKEIKKWANLCYHRRTVRYFGSAVSGSALMVFMEFVSWGSLRTRLDEGGVLSPSVVGKLSLQILEGLKFLHNNGVVHGDLRASNILIEDDENIKLSDFDIFECLKRGGWEGREVEKDDEIIAGSKIKGSWYWMAPEAVRGGDCSQVSDVWAVGITLVEMLTGNPPCHNIGLDDFLERIRTFPFVDYRSPQDVPQMLQSFIAIMLAPDPQGRPDVKTLLCGPFIRLILVPSLDVPGERHYLYEGSYGAIWKGFDSESDLHYLVKEVCTDKYPALKEEREAIMNLIQGYAQLQGHEYVARYFGVTSTPRGLDILMEYVEGGSLKTKIDAEGPFDVPVVTEYSRQLIEALHFLHGQDIIHMDIRAANVLLGEGGRVKLGDFGLSKCLKTRTREYRPESSVTVLLSPSFFWMAPEVLESLKYSKASDVWSLGATVFEMLTGNPPNHNLTPFAVMENMKNPDKPKCDFPTNVPRKIRKFIEEMLDLCAEGRPTTEDLLQSPFILTVQVPSLVYYEKETDALGRGSLGEVYRCRYNRLKMDFVVKEVYITAKRLIGRTRKEIDEYSRLPINERVLRYFGTSHDEKGLNIFREYFPGKSLKTRLLEDGPLSPDMIARYSKQILEGLSFLHLNEVVHGDVRGSNVIVEDNNIRLCDFGVYDCFKEIAFKAPDEDSLTSHIESICFWKAPEILRGESSSQWSDIWSLGATVVEMMTGVPPYFSQIPSDAIESIRNSSKVPYKAASDTPQSFYAFLDSMFIHEPHSRASVQTLLESAFILDLLVPSIDDYIQEELLGQGAYGAVYKCFDRQTKTHFAVKAVKINSGGGDFMALKNEISIYKKLNCHERILRYFGTSNEDGILRIFMENIPGGSLRSKLYEKGPFPPEVISLYTKQILEGLDFLHQKKIIHRDIKGENILRVDDSNVKLCDFGVSFSLSSTILRDISVTMPLRTNNAERVANTIIGTYYWMAPEVVKGRTYDFSADVWSLGATVVEMLSGNPPFYHLDPMPAIFKIGCTARVRYESPQYVPPALLSFLDSTFVIDPLKRATVQRLLQCDFIRERQIVADGGP